METSERDVLQLVWVCVDLLYNTESQIYLCQHSIHSSGSETRQNTPRWRGQFCCSCCCCQPSFTRRSRIQRILSAYVPWTCLLLVIAFERVILALATQAWRRARFSPCKRRCKSCSGNWRQWQQVCDHGNTRNTVTIHYVLLHWALGIATSGPIRPANVKFTFFSQSIHSDR